MASELDSPESLDTLEGVTIVDRDGHDVGEVQEVHRDPFTGKPAWVTVKAGLLSGKSLVPIGEGTPAGGRLQVPYDAATIKGAPYLDLDAEESEGVAAEGDREGADDSIVDDKTATRPRTDHWRVYEYYGLPFGRPDVAGSAAPDVDYGFGSAGTSPEAEGARRTPDDAAVSSGRADRGDDNGGPAR